jgi:hypothetical protein
MIKIGKYAFNSKEQAIEKIEGLGVAQDEDGNNYPTHKHTIVELGYEVISEGVINEDGEVVEEAVFGTDYLVDVLWNAEGITTIEEEAVLDEEGNVIVPAVTSIDHPYGWKSYSVDIETEGIHSFMGLNYQSLKF